MGKLGATIMVYPPTWWPISVRVFALSDRGQIYDASAATLFPLAATGVLLFVVGAIRFRRRSIRT